MCRGVAYADAVATPDLEELRAAVVEIRFEPSRRSVRVDVGTTLLEAARHAKLPIASACGSDGVCARCGLEILEGAETLPDETDAERVLKARNRVDGKLRLACRVRVNADITATAPYW